MNKVQTMAAALVLMLGISIGIFYLFKDPIPYAYNNLPDHLNQTMRKNGVNWAKITVDGNQVLISGIAPNSGEMIFAKSLIQKEAGVSANFMGVEVRDIKTRDDFESDKDWEAFKKKNPVGSFQLNSSRLNQARSSLAGESQFSSNPTSAGTTVSNQKAMLEDEYVLNFQSSTIDCKVENRLNTNDYVIIFKGSTAIIDSRSLTDLDWIADLDETCTLELKLIRKGEKDDKNLSNRRIDEVRYHLMSAGIISKRIITDHE